MKNTKIEWCDHSWSPWTGCTKVSPGCANCYAETLNHRFGGDNWGKGKPRRIRAESAWKDPVRWNRRHFLECRELAEVRCELDEAGIRGPAMPQHPTVFPSLCDWLDPEVPVEWLARFLGLIHATPSLRWLLLTKRPENWFDRVGMACGFLGALAEDGDQAASGTYKMVFDWRRSMPPANVWIGTSVEDQQRANERIPALLKIPAAGRFLSLEPLLGPVNLFTATGLMPEEAGGARLSKFLDWIIVGGESGPGARPCLLKWIRSLRDQGRAASLAVLIKQVGSLPVRESTDEPFERIKYRRLLGDTHHEAVPYHPKGGDPAEWPEDLRVREFPEGLR